MANSKILDPGWCVVQGGKNSSIHKVSYIEEAKKVLANIHARYCGSHNNGKALAHKLLMQDYYGKRFKKNAQEFVRK